MAVRPAAQLWLRVWPQVAPPLSWDVNHWTLVQVIEGRHCSLGVVTRHIPITLMMELCGKGVKRRYRRRRKASPDKCNHHHCMTCGFFVVTPALGRGLGGLVSPGEPAALGQLATTSSQTWLQLGCSCVDPHPMHSLGVLSLTVALSTSSNTSLLSTSCRLNPPAACATCCPGLSPCLPALPRGPGQTHNLWGGCDPPGVTRWPMHAAHSPPPHFWPACAVFMAQPGCCCALSQSADRTNRADSHNT
jgi:hypothetical protein